jgi:hypothetical protein
VAQVLTVGSDIFTVLNSLSAQEAALTEHETVGL